MSEVEEATETWRNQSNGSVWVWKTDRFGRMKDETVKSGGKFNITPLDRQNNQERAASPGQDLFSNGTLAPVKLLDTADDVREIAENPNLITESGMVKLFSLHHTKFDARLAEIENATVLKRIKALAENEETGATLRQVRRIEDRLDEVTNVYKPEDTTGARVGGERHESVDGGGVRRAHTP